MIIIIINYGFFNCDSQRVFRVGPGEFLGFWEQFDGWGCEESSYWPGVHARVPSERKVSLYHDKSCTINWINC